MVVSIMMYTCLKAKRSVRPCILLSFKRFFIPSQFIFIIATYVLINMALTIKVVPEDYPKLEQVKIRFNPSKLDLIPSKIIWSSTSKLFTYLFMHFCKFSSSSSRLLPKSNLSYVSNSPKRKLCVFSRSRFMFSLLLYL